MWRMIVLWRHFCMSSLHPSYLAPSGPVSVHSGNLPRLHVVRERSFIGGRYGRDRAARAIAATVEREHEACDYDASTSSQGFDLGSDGIGLAVPERAGRLACLRTILAVLDPVREGRLELVALLVDYLDQVVIAALKAEDRARPTPHP